MPDVAVPIRSQMNRSTNSPLVQITLPMNSIRFRALISVLFAVVFSAAACFADSKSAVNPDSVVIFDSEDDVKGMVYVSEITAISTSKIGAPALIRKSAIANLKKATAAAGGTVVYVPRMPSFGPFENPQIVGFAYRPAMEGEEVKEQESESEGDAVIVSAPSDWTQVKVTRNPNEVKGLTRIGDVESVARMAFGSQSKLRARATDDLKKKAFEKGASIIFVEVDHFAHSPINNVTMSAACYK